MNLRKIYHQLNLPAQCQKYNVPLWQCPQFLFLIMGIIIIGAATTAYLIGTHYIEDPQLIALIVLALSGTLFIFAYIINVSFEKLAEASRIRTEFVRIVSHQLRSPITNLSWAIDGLMSGDLGRIAESQLEYFKILKENSARMKELIKDLLITSRIEEGTLPIKKEKVSLIEIIKSLVSEFQPFARASNVETEFSYDENLPKILTDPQQIKVVMENLLDNAIRYSQRKGKIKIRLERKGDDIYFEIKDSGVGIPQEDQKYIFQKFFRSKSKEKGGTGLGLFITKSIIEKLGGKIWFESEEGKGTTFYFTLPIFTK
jgi:signal transduction histidine kinase